MLLRAGSYRTRVVLLQYYQGACSAPGWWSGESMPLLCSRVECHFPGLTELLRYACKTLRFQYSSDLHEESLGNAANSHPASLPPPNLTPVPTILPLVGLPPQTPGQYPRSPFPATFTTHGWPQSQASLRVAPHHIMTDVIDVQELLSPLKTHSRNICLH